MYVLTVQTIFTTLVETHQQGNYTIHHYIILGNNGKRIKVSVCDYVPFRTSQFAFQAEFQWYEDQVHQSKESCWECLCQIQPNLEKAINTIISVKLQLTLMLLPFTFCPSIHCFALMA